MRDEQTVSLVPLIGGIDPKQERGGLLEDFRIACLSIRTRTGNQDEAVIVREDLYLN